MHASIDTTLWSIYTSKLFSQCKEFWTLLRDATLTITFLWLPSKFYHFVLMLQGSQLQAPLAHLGQGAHPDIRRYSTCTVARMTRVSPTTWTGLVLGLGALPVWGPQGVTTTINRRQFRPQKRRSTPLQCHLASEHSETHLRQTMTIHQVRVSWKSSSQKNEKPIWSMCSRLLADECLKPIIRKCWVVEARKFCVYFVVLWSSNPS